MNDLTNILSLLGIPGELVQSSDVLMDKETGISIISIELVDARDTCPYCFEKNRINIKDYYYVHINNSVVQHWNIIVKIRMRRYVCKTCGKTFKQSFYLYAPRKRMSISLRQTMIESLKDRKTYSQIAKECNVSSTTVINLFDTLKCESRLPFGSVLCIDEFHFGKRRKLLGNYPCVLSNPFSSSIIDIIESRRKDVLNEYFRMIPSNERIKVKYFVSDMNESYRTIKKVFFRDSIHIIDHFHVAKLFAEAIQTIRIRIMKQNENESKEYRYLKKNWKLFIMNRKELMSKTFFQKRTGYRINLADEVDYVLRKYPELNVIYNMKIEFEKRMLKLRYYEDVKMDIDFFINQWINSPIKELNAIGNTFQNWYREIINSYAKNSTQFVLTNAVAEANNNNIQTLINVSYGCHNYKRFRKRILYIDRNKK